MQSGYDWFLWAACIWAIFAMVCWNMAFGKQNVYWLIAACVTGGVLMSAVAIEGWYKSRHKK